MTTNKTHIAKITRPNISGVFSRERLMTLLDDGRKLPAVWVAGPGGSGKTTLAADYLDERKLPCLWYQVDASDADPATFFYYMGLAAQHAAPRYRKPLPLLTPEYLQGISTFARRFFENLYGRLKPPFAIVFDNYQNIPAGSMIHDIVESAVALLPEGLQILVLSRNEPPPVFTRLRANRAMHLVGWDELRFTLEESKQLIRLKVKSGLTEEALVELHEKAEGWAAGLVLISEGAGTNMQNVLSSVKRAQGEVFDYFAGEVFDKLDSETRDFLLMTSFLPKMTVQTAAKLTGEDNAGGVLAALNRNNFFTEKHLTAEPTYQYHPLFREFLLARMKESLSGEGLLRIQKRAAVLLEESGQVEDAVQLLRDAQDWENHARLILSHAQSLVMQGRSRTLLEWFADIPGQLLETMPWLQYWKGACTVPFNPVESQRYFERAFELFTAVNEPAGLFLSWSGVMEAIFLGWGEFKQADYWIDMLEELMRRHPQFPTPEIDAKVTTSMLFALTLRQPHHPDIRTWADRARAVALTSTNIRLKSFINVYLELYYLWSGDHSGAEVVIAGVRESASTGDASPLAQILGRVIEAVYQVRMGKHDLCRKAVEDGLAIAATTGVVIWNSQLYSQGAINALSEENAAEAEGYLQKMEAGILEARRIDACMYRYNSAWYAMLQGDFLRSFQQLEAALRFALEAGTPFHEGITRIALAQVLHEQDADDKALPHLAKAQGIAAGMKSHILEYMCLVSKAQFDFARHDDKARESLARALALGRQEGYTNFYWWRSGIMSRLCSTALDAGIETAYVYDLIRKRSLKPQADVSEQWPWPLKIHTLGRFELVRNGEPVKFSGKVQQKPLGLLKMLIAFGGKDVAEERFTDALWPDADGDLAHKSFEMTVQRLRRLIGNDKIIQLQERRLTLDAGSCWVDIWTLEDLFVQVAAAWKDAGASVYDSAEVEKLSEKAITLYQGHFLPGDSAHPWVLLSRERLRSKFLRHVVKIGELRERAMQWKSAADLFQRGLEVDGLNEEFYQHLMVCYQQLGRQAEALSVYERCRALLSSTLGISPSPRTEDLYQSIRNGR